MPAFIVLVGARSVNVRCCCLFETLTGRVHRVPEDVDLVDPICWDREYLEGPVFEVSDVLYKVEMVAGGSQKARTARPMTLMSRTAGAQFWRGLRIDR